MANLFDTTQAREGEPTQVVPGDFLAWKRSDLVTDYPPGEYTAEYVARITGGGDDEIKLAQNAGTTSSYYLFVVDSATSSNFSVGLYHWQLEITKVATGDRVVVDIGDFRALADLDSNQADPRSHARKMVDAIEAMLEGRADTEELDAVQSTIGDRSLTRGGLLDMHRYYSRIVASEDARIAHQQGKSLSGFVRSSFR